MSLLWYYILWLLYMVLFLLLQQIDKTTWMITPLYSTSSYTHSDHTILSTRKLVCLLEITIFIRTKNKRLKFPQVTHRTPNHHKLQPQKKLSEQEKKTKKKFLSVMTSIYMIVRLWLSLTITITPTNQPNQRQTIW